MKRLLWALLLFAAFAPLAAADQAVIAVLDFSTDGVSRSEMKSIVNLLSSALFQTGRFTVIDVGERERLLQELEFSVGDSTDESRLLQAGRMLSAERIVLGNIGKVGSRYILSAKMLETETARTVSTADGIYVNLDALVDDLFVLAEKLVTSPGAKPAGPVAEAPSRAPPPAAPEPATTPPEGEQPDETPRARRGPTAAGSEATAADFWLLGLQGGANVPLGASSEALGVGIPAMAHFGYALERARGVFSFGILGGIQYQGSRPEVRYPYHLLTASLGAEVRYAIRWDSPWSLRAAAAGGVTFNYVAYKEAHPFRDNLVNASPFVAPSLGVGYRLSPRLSLVLDSRLWTVFFTDLVYLGLAPSFGVELALGERRAPALPAAPEELPENHGSVSVLLGVNVPVGAMGEALGPGVPALATLGYTLERPRGAFDFAALAGVQYQSSRTDVRYGYHLLSVPLGAEVGYTTRWESPWHLRVGAAGGVTVNYVIYKEAYPFRDNLLKVSPFVAPSLGMGYGLSARLSLELNAYLWTVFYTDAIYVGIAPAFGLRIAL